MAARFLSNEGLIAEFERSVKFNEAFPEATSNLRDELLRRLSARNSQAERACFQGGDGTLYETTGGEPQMVPGTEPERSDGRIDNDADPFTEIEAERIEAQRSVGRIEAGSEQDDEEPLLEPGEDYDVDRLPRGV